MLPKKLQSKRKKPKKKRAQLDPAEALARNHKRQESLKKRTTKVEEINEILTKRKAERTEKKNASRDAEIKLYENEVKNRSKTIQEKRMIQIREDMKSILVAGLDKVNALKVVGDKVKLEGSTMTINGSKYKLKSNVHMVGWGRETLMLGASLEKLIGKHLRKGFLVVPRGSVSGMWDNPLWFPALNSRITFLEGGSMGMPNEKSVEATRGIADYCKKLRKADILVVVLSGGTEALLNCPKGAIRLEEVEEVLSILKTAKATPMEIDAVRRKLSAVFGGELARLAYPAKVVTLVMSDVPGNLPHLVAGSPTVNDPGKDAALAVVRKYKLEESLPPAVREVLHERPPVKDPLVDENYKFKFVDYHVLADTGDAIRGMTDAAFRLGLVPVSLSSTVVGPVREVSRAYAQVTALMILAAEGKISKLEMYDAMKFDRVLPLSEEKIREIFPSKERWGLGLCLLSGGAPNADLSEESRTGPNQDLALYFSLDWYLKVKENPILNDYVVWFLGGSTDGIDGNTKAAGAYGYGSLGPAVFKRYKELTLEESALDIKVRGMLRADPESQETRNAVRRYESLRDELSRVSAILPDRVLRERNANFMFTNINDGDELLNLGYTYTNVCDLHIIRIARYQCSCNGQCLAPREELPSPKELCRDEKCAANRTVPKIVVPPRNQCCARSTGPKLKIY
ncbi:glycerate kinase-like [Neodiprion virginianus]|uniref:glycerate kinase-like n=1 Tax=Neodiprion virginianus TaxID=2961670 RepID=UPI001EE74156|nr:glycerate kinase-like [Neodiprion virginianus]